MISTDYAQDLQNEVCLCVLCWYTAFISGVCLLWVRYCIISCTLNLFMKLTIMSKGLYAILIGVAVFVVSFFALASSVHAVDFSALFFPATDAD